MELQLRELTNAQSFHELIIAKSVNNTGYDEFYDMLIFCYYYIYTYLGYESV